MTTEGSSEEGQESGGALRDKLEQALADAKAAREALATEVAERFQYVKPGDLAAVAPGELRERAAQIEQERVAERHEVLTTELIAKGWTEAQVEALLGEKSEAPPQQVPKPKLDSNLGAPPSRPKPGAEDGLSGPSRIRAALGS